MVSQISFFLIAAGLSGIALAVRVQLPHSGFYSVGSELIIYALLIVTGVGLYFRMRVARTLALGWLKVGALAIILLPISAFIWQIVRFDFKQAVGLVVMLVLVPVFAIGTVSVLAGLAVFSYLCRGAYRYLGSEDVLRQFRPGSGFDSWLVRGDRDYKVYACVVVYLALAFYAQHRLTVSESSLPRSMQTREHLEQVEKWRREALARLVRQPLFSDGGKTVVFLLEGTRFGYQALCYVDVASGKMTRTEVPTSFVKSSNPELRSYGPERHLSPDRLLLWAGGNEILDLRTGEHRKMQMADEYGRLAPIGFLTGSKQFLLYDPTNLRIQLLDVETGTFVYSVDATPPGGFTREEYRVAFHGQITDSFRSSTLSQDRGRFAYLYLDTLYVLDTAAGTLDSYPASGHEIAPSFSREGDWVITRSSGSDSRGALYDLKGRKRIVHGLKGALLYFSSATRTIVSTDFQTVVRTDLSALDKARWQIPLSGRRDPAVTEDGKRLYVFNPATSRIEQLDLDTAGGEAPPQFAALPVELTNLDRHPVVYSPDRRLIVYMHSPGVTLIRLDADAAPATTALDFTQFAYRPKD